MVITKDKKLYLIFAITSLGIALAMFLLILFFPKFLPKKLPLFYSLPWGETQLGSFEQFFIIPGIITLITLLNMIISWQLHPTQAFFKKILTISILPITLILTATFIKIVLIFI